MITITQKDLHNANLDGVVLTVHDGENVRLYTLDDPEGQRANLRSVQHAQRWLIIEAADNERAAGVKIADIEFDLTERTQLQLGIKAQMAQFSPAPRNYQVATRHGRRAMNNEQVIAAFHGVAERIQAIDERLSDQLDAIAAATTVAEIQAITW